jgi:Asp-tRNA(Asn)/Glu-tRNA(Gln) amidotransferase A subunit family amidase
MELLSGHYQPIEDIVTEQELRRQTRNVIEKIEASTIDAFCHIERTPSSLESEQMADQLLCLPLRGLPVAIKEVIDVAGAPGGYGCAAFASRVPVVNADIVTQLEGLGAQVIGITRATEMALAGEPTTRNPWSACHSPGGSSSGSAAAVGAGLVPLALGTQTIGSVIRPAAYCGVIGFKPSVGIGSMNGVLQLSKTLDHVGYFADSLNRLKETVSALFPELPPAISVRPRLVFVEPWFNEAKLESYFFKCNALKHACSSSGIDWIESRLALDLAAQDQSLINTILGFELFENWGDTLLNHPATSEELQDLLCRGRVVSREEYEAAMAGRQGMIQHFENWLTEGDVLVFPSVLDLPPKLGQGTGSRDPQRIWTLLGMPALNLPVGWHDGFPLNLQLIAKRNTDMQLLEAASLVSSLISPFIDEKNRT